MDRGKQLLNLCSFKAGKIYIEILILKIDQQIRQQTVIPCTCNFIQRNVEGLFSGLVHIYYRTRNFRVSHSHCHGQTLVTANNCHICIYHQRICKSKLLNRILYFFVFLITRLQLFPRVIFRRFKLRNRNASELCSCIHKSSSFPNRCCT